MSKTALYRHFDASGALLYVGISLNPVKRQQAHMNGANWSDDITRVDVQWFATRSEAEMAEWVAIRDENPLHNVRRSENPPHFKPERTEKVRKCEPANTIIKVCGGVDAVAEMVGRHPINVRKWAYPSDRGGSEGLIPADCQQTLYRAARARSLPLTPEHFFPVSQSGAA
jgi:hypothetical protein